MSLANPTNLIQHGRSLYSTWSAYYNEPYKHHTRFYLPLVDKYVDRIVDTLQLKDTKFIFKPLSARTNGLTFPVTEITYIDPRRETYQEVVHTMCHEAIHLFQIQNGRLQFCQKTGKFMWDGVPHTSTDALKQKYESYLELPWEVDANAKMNSLYFDVMKTKMMPTLWPKVK